MAFKILWVDDNIEELRSHVMYLGEKGYEVEGVTNGLDALAVMAQGYILLGMDDLAKDSIEVLALNFPEHPSIDKNGEFASVYTLDGLQRSWINKASFGLFDPPQPPQFDNRPKT